MPYYEEPSSSTEPSFGWLHESALSIRLALAWLGWLLFCVAVLAPVILKLWPSSGEWVHQWLYYAVCLGGMGLSAAGVAFAFRQLNAGLRPRVPVVVGLVVCVLLVVASSPVARFAGEKARAILHFGEQMPWKQPLDDI